MTRVPLLLCLWLSAGAAAAAVPPADALWQKGDYRAAFAVTVQPAAEGDAHAQFLLGEAYRLGRSVDPNFPLAQDWYGRAAQQGDIAAATELGLLLSAQHLYAEAAPWLSRAALHGDPRALCSLAALYFNGTGVARDPALALALMTRAAAAGLPEAQPRLAALRASLDPTTSAWGVMLAKGAWAGALQPAELPRAIPQPKLGARASEVAIQVGAFGTRAAAEEAWARLGQTVAGTGNVDRHIVRAGRFYRLQARFDDAANARTFCRRLTTAGWDHFVRPRTGGNANRRA